MKDMKTIVKREWCCGKRNVDGWSCCPVRTCRERWERCFDRSSILTIPVTSRSNVMFLRFLCRRLDKFHRFLSRRIVTFHRFISRRIVTFHRFICRRIVAFHRFICRRIVACHRFICRRIVTFHRGTCLRTDTVLRVSCRISATCLRVRHERSHAAENRLAHGTSVFRRHHASGASENLRCPLLRRASRGTVDRRRFVVLVVAVHPIVQASCVFVAAIQFRHLRVQFFFGFGRADTVFAERAIFVSKAIPMLLLSCRVLLAFRRFLSSRGFFLFLFGLLRRLLRSRFGFFLFLFGLLRRFLSSRFGFYGCSLLLSTTLTSLRAAQRHLEAEGVQASSGKPGCGMHAMSKSSNASNASQNLSRFWCEARSRTARGAFRHARDGHTRAATISSSPGWAAEKVGQNPETAGKDPALRPKKRTSISSEQDDAIFARQPRGLQVQV